MKNIIIIISIMSVFISCNNEKSSNYEANKDWSNIESPHENYDNLTLGKSYLPLYSHIYHTQKNRTFDLTITISIRNVSTTDSIYILKADYFNTDGKKIRQYITDAIFLEPLQTIEIIIPEQDKEGGSGANFIFDWAIKDSKNPPLFEAVMISPYRQQGLSFTSRAIQIHD